MPKFSPLGLTVFCLSFLVWSGLVYSGLVWSSFLYFSPLPDNF